MINSPGLQYMAISGAISFFPDEDPLGPGIDPATD
jgi:preprotein translocase subunit Sec61beta